ncbi:MAG: hypothetical protein GF364_16975 [Candidatus Lokiarchaeota archaeon]|nr:hypothetical protein [Candidatus Lokiarchaeota archaeon]
MIKNTKRMILLFICALMLIFPSLNETNNGADKNLSNNTPITSESHGPIFIDGDAALDTFCSGNNTYGTESSPHIIKDYEITDSAVPIYITNTDKHLIIKNCTCVNTANTYAIRIYNSGNVTIENCKAKGGYGIWMFGKGNNTLNDSTVYDCPLYGIKSEDATNNTINNNTIYGCENNIVYLDNSDEVLCFDNEIYNNTATINIRLEETQEGKIYNNDIINNTGIGINITQNTANCSIYQSLLKNNTIGIQAGGNNVFNITISNNTIIDSTLDGISWMNNEVNGNHTIMKNQIDHNRWNGIYYDAENITITGNNCTYNGLSGINVTNSYGYIAGNNCSFNNISGINAHGSHFNISLNYISNNDWSQAYNGDPTNNWDNETIGNYWGDYNDYYSSSSSDGIVWDIAYQINQTGTIYDDKPLVNPDDAPATDNPSDKHYETGTTDNWINWTITDWGYINGTYVIKRNGTYVERGQWENGNRIDINIDGLTPDHDYAYTISLDDGTAWGTSEDVVLVSVNTYPEAQNVQLSPLNPYTNQSLTASYDYYDDDGDEEDLTEIRWYKDDVLQSTFNDQLTVDCIWTNKSEEWNFTVRPHDGQDYGNIVWSNKIQIQNHKPRVENVTLTPATPYTNDDLVLDYDYLDIDDDTLSFSIRWYNNTVHIPQFDDQTTVTSHWINRSQTWYATVEADDTETTSGVVQSNPITVQNSVPTVTGITISPSNANTTNDLILSYTFNDLDNDADSSLIEWYNNSVHIAMFDGETTIPNTWINKSDVWEVQITPDDGIDTGTMDNTQITIINYIPEVADVNIGSDSLTTEDIVLNYNFIDYDLDPDNSIIQWYNNSVYIAMFDGWTSIPAVWTNKSQEWNCTVTPQDDETTGTPVSSNTIIIMNTIPQVSDLSLGDSEITTVVDIDVSFIFNDADLDENQSQILWYKGGLEQSQFENWTSLPASWTNKSEMWHVEVIPYDGTDHGTLQVSNAVEIINTQPIVLITGFNPVNPETTDNLILSYAWMDADNDADNSMIKWYIDGLYHPEYDGEQIIYSSETGFGEAWNVTITPNDGEEEGAPANSVTRWVGNTPPIVENITITPYPYEIDSIQLSYDYYDINGHTETGTTIRWYKNSQAMIEFDGASVIPSENVSAGDIWHVSVRPNDGYNYGDLVLSDEVVVLANQNPEILYEPLDLELQVHTTRGLINWTLIDSNIRDATYTVKRNEIKILSNIEWENGDSVIISLEDLDVGRYTFEIVIDDGLGGQLTDTVQINILPNPVKDILIYIAMGITAILMLGSIITIQKNKRSRFRDEQFDVKEKKNKTKKERQSDVRKLEGKEQGKDKDKQNEPKKQAENSEDAKNAKGLNNKKK